jgi:hypothetical protein
MRASAEACAIAGRETDNGEGEAELSFLIYESL